MTPSDLALVNFAPLTGIVFLLIFIFFNSDLQRSVKRSFTLLVLLEFVELVMYSAELYTATLPYLVQGRIWLSAIGYTIRPILIYLILRITLRDVRAGRGIVLMSLPLFVNAVAAFSALFTDVAYSYTPDNLFVRGPLGFTSQIVISLYLVLLLVILMYRRKNRGFETLIVVAGVLLVVFAMAIEAMFNVRTTGRTAIVLTTVFYYMFFQTRYYHAELERSQEKHAELTRLSYTDPLTSVKSKIAWYEAVRKFDQAISSGEATPFAVAVFDVNYLKQINDTLGHGAGDKLLQDACSIICRHFSHSPVFRIGGDEFTAILERQDFENRAAILEQFRQEAGSGEICVAGGMSDYQPGQDENFDSVFRRADVQMYRNKVAMKAAGRQEKK